MSSIVSSDQGARRVSPKVFHDVPSAAELASVRKNRNQLAVWIVLLFGMLIAAIAGLVWMGLMLQQQEDTGRAELASNVEETTKIRQDWDRIASLVQPMTNADTLAAGDLERPVNELVRERSDVLEALQDVRGEDADTPSLGNLDRVISEIITEQTQEIETLSSQVDETRRLRREYGALHELNVEAGQLKAEIEELLNNPLREDARDSLGQLTTYDAEFEVVSRDDVQSSLQAYSDGLRADRDRILAWRPRGPEETWNPPAEPDLVY